MEVAFGSQSHLSSSWCVCVCGCGCGCGCRWVWMWMCACALKLSLCWSSFSLSLFLSPRLPGCSRSSRIPSLYLLPALALCHMCVRACLRLYTRIVCVCVRACECALDQGGISRAREYAPCAWCPGPGPGPGPGPCGNAAPTDTNSTPSTTPPSPSPTLPRARAHTLTTIHAPTQVVLFLSAHWMCCLWFWVGFPEGWVVHQGMVDEAGHLTTSLYFAWITSFYWSITTMTTIGYGDISAGTGGKASWGQCWVRENFVERGEERETWTCM